VSADPARPWPHAQAPDHDSSRPLVLDADHPDDAAALRDLLGGPTCPVVHDTIADQVLDLMSSLHPREATDPSDRAALARAHVAGRSLHSYGRWVHYPWSNRLVHVLPPDEFAHLRGDRNRYRITAAEQDHLRAMTIGVVGLSVGQATALTMSTEGVGGRFRLADFDALDLSNLNRLRAGVHELGVSKAVVAARAMAETDPYLHVDLFRDGLHEHNLDAFLRDGGALDLLVEECDDLFTKVAVRERARALRIPVLMETSDRGMVDVERFDLEPDRPVLHGLLGEVCAEELRGLTTTQKIPYVLRILDGTRISPDLVASLFEVRETIHTWPQLASAVALGGAVVTDVARRMLLGTFAASGRFYVDLGELVKDETAEQPTVETTAPVPDAPTPDLAPPAFVPGGPVGRDEARHLAAHAALGLVPAPRPW
jgi:tRNA A37 threonylcarbamoyladenosine dehydratase